MIAPDPSPEITETLALFARTRGMNSCFAWTVFRVTMSFYGVAHPPSEIADECHSLGSVRAAEADRQIGVWCITPGSLLVCCNRNVKRSRNRPPK